MDFFQFDEKELSLIEKSCVPYAVYQYINKHIKTLALTEGFCKLFGFDRMEEAYYIMDNDMYRDVHPDDISKISEAALLFAKEETEYNVVYRSKKNDDYTIIHAIGKHIYTDKGKIAYVWYFDEGSVNESRDRLLTKFDDEFSNGYKSSKFNYDYLTGLPSMGYFYELVDLYRKDARKDGLVPAMLFVDVCGMKYYNQKYGYYEGDKLIQAVAKLLTEYFPSECCSRFGQDHFGVITTNKNIEKTLNDIFEECPKLSKDGKLPLRVGIYIDKNDDVMSSICYDHAKFACDINRKAYFSHFNYYDEKMQISTDKFQYIINNIDRAIEEKWIKVYYQPIVRAINGLVCDEEALARWIDPDKGLLSPADFIPALEDSKLIYKLDLFMVEEVLEKMKRQASLGLYIVPQSINLSRADFEICDMVKEIEDRVDRAGISRDKLTIEITESVIGSDFDFMKGQIEKFRNEGFKVWMDDFGSGYSSLNLLQSISFDVIKLDMSFTRQLGNNENKKIILTGLINMINSLGMEVVAEGVETKEQAEFLTEIGCSKLQGFYFCKPIPMEEIIERNKKGIQIGFENPNETE